MPLGGLGEVGLNMFLLEWEKQVLVVDSGLMFPHEETPGVDLIVPDVSYLLEGGRRVLGIVITHGHEDHVGGLPFLLKKVNAPVFGTRLTLALAQHRLREYRVLKDADLRTIAPGDLVPAGSLPGGGDRGLPLDSRHGRARDRDARRPVLDGRLQARDRILRTATAPTWSGCGGSERTASTCC